MIQVLNGLTQNISSNKYQLGKNVQESILDKLPNTTKEELLHVSFLNSYVAAVQKKMELMVTTFIFIQGLI